MYPAKPIFKNLIFKIYIVFIKDINLIVSYDTLRKKVNFIITHNFMIFMINRFYKALKVLYNFCFHNYTLRSL